MKCRNCKNKIPNGKKFCPACGAKVKKSGAIWALLALVVVILGVAVTGALAYFKVVDIPVVLSIVDKLAANDNKAGDTAENAEETSATNVENYDLDITKELEESNKELEKMRDEIKSSRVDPDEYFEKNSTVISKTDVGNSTTIQSESQAVNTLTSRGFTEYPITAEYSIDGEYIGKTEVSSESDTKHPIYQTQYAVSDDEIWTIFLINGRIMAYPVSYNAQSDSDAEVILSETESIVSYDSAVNRFYETKPNASEVTVKKIDQINADSLSKLGN